jgi:hypothetical protein
MTMTDTPSTRNASPSRDDFTARLIEHITDDELADLLARLDPTARRTALAPLLLHPPKGRPDPAFARKVRERALARRRQGLLLRFCDALSSGVSIEAKTVLGDSFDDPSVEDIEHLTRLLRERCGDTTTRLLYAVVVDDDRVAADKIRPLLEQGPLAIPPHLPAESVERTPAAPARAVDPALRARRRQRDQTRKIERATRVAQVSRAPQRPRRAQKHTDAPEIRTPQRHVVAPPPVVKRTHPHLSHYRSFSETGTDVGSVVLAFIPYTGQHAGEGKGKVRPALVIASNRDRFLVRPVYSHPRHYAGAWRAVDIRDWREAGLRKPSYVGDEIHRVKRSGCHDLGRLTLEDWNRVCLGEVNLADS